MWATNRLVFFQELLSWMSKYVNTYAKLWSELHVHHSEHVIVLQEKYPL